MEVNKCPFLQLPTELRLVIYSFALLDSPVVTVGSAELVGSHPDVVHRLYGQRRTPHSGLPKNHEPVIEPCYNSSLLSLVNPAIIPLAPATSCPPEEPPYSTPHATHGSLLLVNKQVKEELDSHFKLPKNRSTSLFVSYPDGLHVLRTLAPHLIKQARSVHIAGAYTSRSFCAPRAACLGSSAHPPFIDQRYNGNFTPNSAGHLSNLIASLFGPNSPQGRIGGRGDIQALELRTYYPGSDSYSTVWGDDNSPTVIALRNIYAGEVSIEVWRGQRGTGVYLTARPVRKECEKRRVVSTVWRRLEEGRRGEARCGSWVVDPAWPCWEEADPEPPTDATVVSVVAERQEET
ncbi:hypothetical protein LTR37_015833 [Vermiconidia calcicola]|uniref:Uncharacterized protein n=1 Tax=Vermiconidia calcicola TaxID=1690605 RepID=A0ACC3MPJ5_9PEZI|nr:hypothetical protein LTR37_015833 [Vermiconidia calcicola]